MLCGSWPRLTYKSRATLICRQREHPTDGKHTNPQRAREQEPEAERDMQRQAGNRGTWRTEGEGAVTTNTDTYREGRARVTVPVVRASREEHGLSVLQEKSTGTHVCSFCFSICPVSAEQGGHKSLCSALAGKKWEQNIVMSCSASSMVDSGCGTFS